ncbi:hypothetical protein E0H39_03160 [Rhizobium leguminosarum bv. viciae]|uniref:hypothetical protein n=1 Tax=Rhizobium leguminosarum TaxID=384 RepID=UPI000B929A64|nr:hypothetical protein [Rhizobium leguminosarum]ASS53113.1 hypothetical protein CHR56_00050 [Rhizobium leguminosarum bv. viciae]ASS57617.1 hypothetical protein CHR56_25385 [Rhizobium leguminosarum bv. viciae]ASS60531.1 hypothetical protein CHR56_39120 [Rhizobium leguminosarum bv. viciae]TBY17461.1 hypothetical protein E0H30_25910 [Rhizobium leguminosarum bv. viciae]TBY24649.1 hypothetical protein E0H37_23310 [Rhizobium leguminosarum bv. viciae]
MAEVNLWTWWQNALAGTIGPIHDGDPQQGYYRTRFKDKPWEPVAIWFEDGKWHAMRGDRQVDASDIWTWCCRNPITYEAYTKAIEGAGWDDEPEAPAIGHNLPSDPFEALQIEFAAEREQAEAFMKKPITTQAEADRAAIWSKRLSTIAKKATDLHKVEKQPHLDAGRNVDNKWRELKEEPDAISKKLKRHMDAFLQEEARKERERQAAARLEADRIQREADAARVAAEKAAAKNDNDAAAVAAQNNAIAEAERLAAQAAQAERDAQARNASAGRTGAKVSLRTFVFAEITDFDALLMALKDRAEIKEVVETLANRAARSGVKLAGMAIRSEQRAA